MTVKDLLTFINMAKRQGTLTNTSPVVIHASGIDYDLRQIALDPAWNPATPDRNALVLS